MMRILFQGDSITDGNRYKSEESRWDLNHQIGHSYAYIVASTLGKKHPGKYTIINRGVSSDCLDRAALRWQTDVLDENPDVLSILLGINGNGEYDGCFSEGVEAHLQHFDSTYRALLDSARAQNPALQLVIIEPFVLPVGRYATHYEAFMSVFARKQQMVKEIAKDYGAIFIPVQERLDRLVVDCAPILEANGCDIDPMKYWLWDGVHPTEAMHGVLAELWLDAAKDIL